jgi:tetratricopeptide (TPR) repeat protein
LLGGLFLLSGCGGSSKEAGSEVCSLTNVRVPLCAPSNAAPQVVAAIDHGNQLFAARRYEGASQKYRDALALQPDLPEGHYNLGLTLQYLGEREEMRKHFIKAANLAPGHKKIWDSPALKRYGDVPDKPASSGAMSTLPGLGGSGGPLGGGS